MGGGAFGNTYAGEKLGIVAEADGISASNSVNLSFGKDFWMLGRKLVCQKTRGSSLRNRSLP